MRKSMIHVSFDPVEAFVPRVPSQRIEGEMEEDSVTKRICASSTILGALRGIPSGGVRFAFLQRLNEMSGRLLKNEFFSNFFY